MSSGSGLLSSEKPLVPHHATAGKEVGDLRLDMERQLAPMRARTVEEYVDPAAAAADSVLTAGAAITSQLVEQVLLPADLDGALGADLGVPRQLTITTAGGTPAESPSSLVVKAKDAKGRLVTETVSLSQAPGTDTSTNFFLEFLEITIPPGTGTGASFTFGHALPIGLTNTPKARAGGLDILWEKESTLGVVTTGSLTDAATDPPYGSYTPATAPNGAEDYAIEFEYDPTLV